MIIETNDDRRMEVLHVANQKVWFCVEDMFGNQETIMIDKEQLERLQFYLAMPQEEI